MSNVNDFVIKNGVLTKYIGNDENILIPEGVTSIGNWAFKSCNSITSITIPESVTTIGKWAFEWCNNLTSITIPNGVTSIGDGAFRGCTSLTDITIPDSVTSIGNYAFKGCSNITTITIPNSVTSIGDYAFSECTNLTDITIPDNITGVGESVFGNCPKLNYNIWENGKYLGNADNPYCALVSLDNSRNTTLRVHADTRVILPLGSNYLTSLTVEGKFVALTPATIKYCSAIERIEIKDEGLYFTKLPASVLEKCAPPLPFAFAFIYLQNSGKKWDEYFASYKGDCNEVIAGFKNALSRIPKLSKKIIQKICDYINANNRFVLPATVVTFYNNVKESYPDVAKALEADKNCSSLITQADTHDAASQEYHPIEKLVDEYLLSNELATKETSVAKIGLPYKNTEGMSSPYVLKVLLNEYIKLWDKNKFEQSGDISKFYQLRVSGDIRYPEITDTIAAELNKDALSDFLEELIKSETSSYRPYLLAYARFANAESIKRIISLIKSRKRGNAKSKYWAENMTEAMYCCDHVAAAEFIECNGNFNRYTAMRGTTPQAYRDEKFLPEFGFDSDGVKRYVVDGKTFEVRISSALTLEITQDDKTIKSIPKKTHEGETAAADFAVIKKEFADFVKKRIEYMKSMYINCETISAESWLKTYGSKQLLLPFAERTIWQNGENVFFEVTDGKICDINGNEFTPTEPVRIAHVLDMTKDEIEQWQARIIALQKTLLIEQVWEPMVVLKKAIDICTRYEGAVLTKEERNEFKRLLKAKAIAVKSMEQNAEFDHRSYSYNFSNQNTMIIASYIKLDYVVDEKTGDTTLGKMNRAELNRTLNTVIFELDRLCTKHHIITDNSEAISENILDGFTLAQITEFIDIASSNNSTNCTALLMDYRNKTFNEVDTFCMFVL